MKPGVYDGIPNAEYHSGPGISKSGLDLIRRSPFHFEQAILAANENRPDTKAYFVGREAHMLILEPSVFAVEYVQAFGRDQAPETIDDREVLAQMVEEINAERVAAHPDAVRDADVLVAKINELNADRLPKLSSSGSKEELVARIISEIHANDPTDYDMLSGSKIADLKAMIAAENEKRPGLLSTSGSRTDLANTLRANGVDVVLWSEITDAYQQEHGRPYVMATSTASRHDMAAWLNANGKNVVLWSDVKAQWDKENEGRQILNPDQWKQIHGMRDAVMAHPAASALLTRIPGRAEQSIYWIDPITGVLCRCRPDWWRDDNLPIDLKTTEDASPEGFARSIAKFRYEVQAAFYLDGIEAATGKRPKNFVFIAVEKKPPHAVGVYVLDAETLEIGRGLYREDLATYAKCAQADQWPGYGDKIQTINLPGWYANKNAHLLESA